LCTHDWPFNVRELSKLAQRMVALHPENAVYDEAALARSAPGHGRLAPGHEGTDASEAVLRPAARPEPTSDEILAALRESRGNVRQAAAALSISRGRLYRLMESIGSIDLDGIRQDRA
jgi:DNA-binding NtrC family response regulator